MDTDKKLKGADGQQQTDLAEGERDTVEESIRIHEEKGDLPRDSDSEEDR